MANILNLTLFQNVLGLFRQDTFRLEVVREKTTAERNIQSIQGITDRFSSAGYIQDVGLTDKIGNLSILDVQVTPRFSVPEQPTERGLKLSDTMIRQPVQATVKVAFPTAGGDTYLQLLGQGISSAVSFVKGLSDGDLTLGDSLYEKTYKALMEAADPKNERFFTIYTKNDVFYRMKLVGLPCDFNPQTLSRSIYTLEFKEIMQEDGSLWNASSVWDGNLGFFAKAAKNIASKFLGAW